MGGDDPARIHPVNRRPRNPCANRRHFCYDGSRRRICSDFSADTVRHQSQRGPPRWHDLTPPFSTGCQLPVSPLSLPHFQYRPPRLNGTAEAVVGTVAEVGEAGVGMAAAGVGGRASPSALPCHPLITIHQPTTHHQSIIRRQPTPELATTRSNLTIRKERTTYRNIPRDTLRGITVVLPNSPTTPPLLILITAARLTSQWRAFVEFDLRVRPRRHPGQIGRICRQGECPENGGIMPRWLTAHFG